MGGLPAPHTPGGGVFDPSDTGSRLAAVGEALTTVTRASIEAALSVALRKVGASLATRCRPGWR